MRSFPRKNDPYCFLPVFDRVIPLFTTTFFPFIQYLRRKNGLFNRRPSAGQIDSFATRDGLSKRTKAIKPINLFFFLYFHFHNCRALTKETEIGICAQHIEDDVVEEILVQGGAVSPIVTIEPRRRKFHKAITVTIPLPERIPHHFNGGRSAGGSGMPSLASSRKTSMESLNRNTGNLSFTE